MARSINSAMGDAGGTIDGVGSLEKNKESGLLRESRDILNEMQAPLDLPTIPADSLAILPSYPCDVRSSFRQPTATWCAASTARVRR